MAAKTNYLKNKLIDWYYRGQAFTPPATLYYGLLTSTNGPRANSTVYASGNTISLTANDGNTHLYKCTTAGTSAAAQSTLYPGAGNEVITDGTAVFTEQRAALEAGTAQVEPTIGTNAYARVAVTGSLANFAGTQGATTTAVSSGTSGTTSNNAAITWAASTGAWGTGYIWGVQEFDAATAGNMLKFGGLTTPMAVGAAGVTPSYAISAFTFQEDN